MRGVACLGRSSDRTLFLPLLLADVPEELGLPAGMIDARSPDGYPGLLFDGEPATLPAILPELVHFLESQRVISCFLRSHPLLGASADTFRSIGHVVEHAPTVGIGLTRSIENLRADMRHGHRYEIGRALEAGFSVRFDDWDLLPAFRDQYNALMDRVDASVAYRFSNRYFDRFADSVDGTAHMATVLSPSGEPAAGSLFTSCDGIVQYHLAASDPRFGKDAVQKVSVDGIIGWALEHGAEWLHLGGGVGARDDSLLRFKSGFGGTPFPYHTVNLVCNPDRVEQADRAWMRRAGHPSAIPSFFPLYRAPIPTRE